MHDRAIVIGPNVISVRYVLVEVVFQARLNVSKVDGDEVVPILSTLLVPKRYSVADFVNRNCYKIKCVGINAVGRIKVKCKASAELN